MISVTHSSFSMSTTPGPIWPPRSALPLAVAVTNATALRMATLSGVVGAVASMADEKLRIAWPAAAAAMLAP